MVICQQVVSLIPTEHKPPTVARNCAEEWKREARFTATLRLEKQWAGRKGGRGGGEKGKKF